LDRCDSDSNCKREFKDMFPPRFFKQGMRDLFKETVGGDVQLSPLTPEAVEYVFSTGALDCVVQEPPSFVRLHPGHMHLVYNTGTQIKFASEVMLANQTAVSAVYHSLYGSQYFSEVNPEDYASMYVKIEQALKERIAGRTMLQSKWLSG